MLIMIVREKKDNLPIFTARKFNPPEDGNLMMYPEVSKVLTLLGRYKIGRKFIYVGDWIVRDQNGNAFSVSNTDFDKGYELINLNENQYRQRRKKFNAIQFNKDTADNGDMHEYPGVIKHKVSRYALKQGWHQRVKRYDNDLTYTICNDSSPLMGYSEDGTVDLVGYNGNVSCTAPIKGYKKVTRLVKHGIFKKSIDETKPIYDFNAPELLEWEYVYWLNDTEAVRDKDWLVTDKDGNARIYKPSEFEEKFEKLN